MANSNINIDELISRQYHRIVLMQDIDGRMISLQDRPAHELSLRHAVSTLHELLTIKREDKDKPVEKPAPIFKKVECDDSDFCRLPGAVLGDK